MPRRRKGPGGARKGSGRKPTRGVAATEVVTIKLTPAEHAAVVARVRGENVAIKDGKPATVSSWFRDHGLDPLRLASFDGERTGESDA